MSEGERDLREESAKGTKGDGKHSDAPKLEVLEADPASEKDSASSDNKPAKPGGKHARHAKEPEVPEYMRRSHRIRKILIAVVVVLVVLLAAGGVLAYMLFNTAQNAATQQTQENVQDVSAIEEENADDASATTAKTTTVPNLVELLGMNTKQAINQLQHGAQQTSRKKVKEEGNPVRAQVKIALTAEPSDARTGTPTVYLSLNKEGKTIVAGYSVSTSSIGYGSISFVDAVTNERIIEKTLEEAGLSVSPDAVKLPEDKMKYSTYASDGKTLTKENCTFEGKGTSGTTEHSWTAVLSYDYSMANATGNLADTIRTIYVYIDAAGVNVAAEPAAEDAA